MVTEVGSPDEDLKMAYFCMKVATKSIPITRIGMEYLLSKLKVTGNKNSFKNWAILSLFLIYFHLFKQTLQFLQQIYVKKMLCPSSIRCRDTNPRPLEHESPLITTRPGLPPQVIRIVTRIVST